MKVARVYFTAGLGLLLAGGWAMVQENYGMGVIGMILGLLFLYMGILNRSDH